MSMDGDISDNSVFVGTIPTSYLLNVDFIAWRLPQFSMSCFCSEIRPSTPCSWILWTCWSVIWEYIWFSVWSASKVSYLSFICNSLHVVSTFILNMSIFNTMIISAAKILISAIFCRVSFFEKNFMYYTTKLGSSLFLDFTGVPEMSNWPLPLKFYVYDCSEEKIDKYRHILFGHIIFKTDWIWMINGFMQIKY